MVRVYGERAVTEIKHILVPTDFNEPAQHALGRAVDLSKRLGAALTLLHVYDIPVYPYTWLEPSADEAASIRAAAQLHLDQALAELRKQVPEAGAVLSSGAPWEQILKVAKDTQANLIVMGTHGRRGIDHWMLGSVAERTVRLSPIPVLTVRA
jgi:nucleotide-binding universal stress UspA family protein